MNSIQDISEAKVFQSAPCVSGMVSLRVGGCCMLPALRPGDVITVRPTRARDITPGRLAVYAFRDEDVSIRRVVRWDPHSGSMAAGVSVSMFTVHRAVRLDENALITRPDTALEDDPPVPFSRVFGEVVAVQRGHSHLIPKEQLTRSQEVCCFFLRRASFLRWFFLRLYSLRNFLRGAPPPQPSLGQVL